ncbi:hypothetical protein BDN71DRAFT_1485273 [Pleurotus eryngii]|uniref:C2H2-type domain-containing protein n=1 Tax=Pleurotus eryngii TaxID=5323 RepID=A0A9P5ZIJ4_PLEER|nr:hypothetical protein BDN71DRAFT_1485273 [Pleurotus eryngii]
MFFLCRFKCPYTGCSTQCRSQSALTKHVVLLKCYETDTLPHPDCVSFSACSELASLPPSPPVLPLDNNLPLSDPPSSPVLDHPMDDLDDQPPPGLQSSWTIHPHLTGDICDVQGQPLPPNTPPPPRDQPELEWAPFAGPSEFMLADLLFHKVEMSASHQNELFDIVDSMMEAYGDASPFANSQDMYDHIDSACIGGVSWECLIFVPWDDLPANAPLWKTKSYEVWYRNPDAILRNLLDNPDFNGKFDYAPYVELDATGRRQWADFMSANFAWCHSSMIYDENPINNKGTMYCPIITGSDKTTVSVATGQVEYHPGYMSIGNVHNGVRRAHCNAVVPFIFFAIPKSDRKYDGDPDFRTFKRQLYHSSVAAVLSHIESSMKTPVVRRCPDGHFRRVIFDLGPVITDYPEQVLLAGIVQGWCAKCTGLPENLDNRELALPRSEEYTNQLIATFDPGTLWDSYGIDNDIPFTNDFPRADIHELLSPDLLHQVIKGTFKDHLVEWVGQYLIAEHGKAKGEAIMDEIDHRGKSGSIAAIPPFPHLRHFPDGRRFKQWTGDDSKALMKVYLPTLVEFLPSGILRTFSAFLNFCYLARRTSFNEDTLQELKSRVNDFHRFCEVFREAGVRSTGFSLPCQHSLSHYHSLIQEYGAPYGLCSSITESRHITAVKKPWRRSNQYNALGQMLLTNQRLDKLVALRTDYVARKLLPPSHNTKVMPGGDEDEDGTIIDDCTTMLTPLLTISLAIAPSYPRTLDSLGVHISVPHLPLLTRRFLYDQLYPNIFHSAVATFYAPSDPCGRHGMYCERLRCTPNWRCEGPRRDCAFLVEDDGLPGWLGISVVRLRLLFSFKHIGVTYPCALVEWLDRVGQQPDPETGLWVVKPDLRGRNEDAFCTVVHLDGLLRAAHLVPVFGRRFLPLGFKHQYLLDSFHAFFVNKYIDYHVFELLS